MTDPLHFAGIPLVTNPYVPEGEVWLVTQGKKMEIHAHEGPQAGEKLEVWLERPRILRRMVLPEWPPKFEPQQKFELEKRVLGEVKFRSEFM